LIATKPVHLNGVQIAQERAATDLVEGRLSDEAAIREYLEAIRWPNGPVCPHCGTVNRAYRVEKKPGLYRCGHIGCRKDFNVKSRTMFEGSHIPLSKWLLAKI
jgi:transposase-like protein